MQQQRTIRQRRPRRNAELLWRCVLTLSAASLLAIVATLHDGARAQTPAASNLATAFTVTNTDDSGPGSLRATIAAAAPGDTINFAVTGTINLTSGELALNKNLTVNGPGVRNLTLQGHVARIFSIAAGANVTISGLKISGGVAPAVPATAGGGGGIKNAGTLRLDDCEVSGNIAQGFNPVGGGIFNDGTLTINNSTIAGNSAQANTGGAGGGIANSGTLTLNNSTLSGNTTHDAGGGLSNFGTAVINNSTVANNFCIITFIAASQGARGGGIYNAGSLSIIASTIAGNGTGAPSLPITFPPSGAGGVYNNSGTLTVSTSIIAGNNATHSNATRSFDVEGAFVSNGYNLIGVVDGSTGFTNGVQHDQVGSLLMPLVPQLSVLSDNGGPTKTILLLCDSPAIDAGDDTVTEPPLNLTTDQRGRARRAGMHVDIGAFESQLGEAQCQTLSINDVSVSEGNTGTTTANFTVSLPVPTANVVSFSYATADGSANAGSDYVAVSGNGFILVGQTSTTISVPVIGDTIIEPDETFTVNLSNPTNALIARGQSVGTISNDDSLPTLQFSAATYQANEGSGSVVVTVTRTGDSTGVATVDYATIDAPAAVPCNDVTTTPNTAYARCDYETTIDRLTFAAGQTRQTFSIPIIDDAHVEQPESFKVALSNLGGATLGTLAQATITIIDNDTGATPNPIDSSPFFVRQHYLDFLSREPEQAGFDAWVGVLNHCPDLNNDPTCDRITVSQSFFGSPEFQFKGYFVYRFYRVAFGRRPHYAEFIADMRRVTGQTSAEVALKRQAFTDAWVERPEFHTRYDALSNAAYVDALLRPYGLTAITTADPSMPESTTLETLPRDTLVNGLDAQPQRFTRAQVLRAIAQSREVGATEFNGAFVTMQYIGYLRRDAEPAGFNAWLNYLNAHPAEARTMVNGFVNSQEYRSRFGRP